MGKRVYWVVARKKDGLTHNGTVAGPFADRSIAESAMVTAIGAGYGELRLNSDVEEDDDDDEGDE